MLFHQGFNWVGVRNGTSLQLYTCASRYPAICYGKEINSKNNVVTVYSEPGRTAQPPPRPRPRV